ncbi:NOP protein chaperone 1 [Dasypus novemcinctus]|uniref:NOP protein chaperone 1 n=1 Tax=Dasypus novemcinctus TaxID=9361 RepID=UPI000328EE4C|nr:NOP protein chaperone 1 [Dasypus novemcinctus]
MELCDERSASCSPTTRSCAGVSVSKDLLTAGSGGGRGILDRLLINSSKKNSTLQTVRVGRSPLLDQVQTFLPQMAQANERLRKEMATAPPGRFDIENVDGTLGKVIQMDVALFEMNQSDPKEEDSSEESLQDSSEDSSESEDEDESIPCEVNIDNIKLPNSEGGKGKIEVLDGPASEKKEIVK